MLASSSFFSLIVYMYVKVRRLSIGNWKEPTDIDRVAFSGLTDELENKNPPVVNPLGPSADSY